MQTASVRPPALGPPPPPPQADRPTGRAALPRRLRRIAAVAAAVVLLPALYSYVHAMAQPSDSSLGVRSVEWLRDHGAAGLVTKVENIYYSLTAPGKGGPALRSLPTVGFSDGTARPPARRPRVTGGHATVPPRQIVSYRPPAVAPLIAPALPGEGVWRSIRRSLAAAPPVLITTLRGQPDYPRVVTGLAWIDTSRTTITLNPGRLEPSVPVPRGDMAVPASSRSRLLATFNSGFKLADSRGGFALNGHTYAALQNGQATFVGYNDGRVNVESWTGGARAPRSVRFARQNLPLIVDHGHTNPNLSDGPEWGATLGNAILVWRSGIGVDRHGNLIYAAGDYQTVRSLADTLRHAGAVRAMELDINDYWVSFITYRRPDARSPVNLLPDMVRSPLRYLTADDRDFFAVYSR